MLDTADKLLDLSESKLILEGTPKEQKEWSKKIDEAIDDLRQDKNERKQVYTRRRDFYTGNQGDYSNIVGVIRDTKQKKGHTNQVVNYAGKTCTKIAFGLANNPPKLTCPPLDINDDIEEIRAQAVEDYIESIFSDKANKFWKGTYRRCCFIQSEFGDSAIKVYPMGDKIKILGHDDMSTLMVGWNGNPGEYDFVITEMLLTAKNIYDQFGIKINEKALGKYEEKSVTGTTSSWDSNNNWGTKSTGKAGEAIFPTGKNTIPRAKVIEYDSDNIYAIKIEDELVQLIFKNDLDFPKMKFWTIIPNIPNPPSPWSIADIDYLIDVQVELNENDNRSADHLRVGNVQRYVAYNMNDFDPESLKTSSGQVIFINDPDGKSRFEPLQTNINNFPDDQYNVRKMQQMFDMGLPKVNYGSSGADSGRSKAIDYQSSIDLTNFKRDAWELALQEICEKIQISGHFLLPDVDWFLNTDGEFVIRGVEFDWTDILPLSQSDKIVNIANKFNMIGLSLEQAYKELGYRNPAALIEELKKELSDPNLMILRSKAWQLSEGLLQAQNQAATLAQSNASETPPPAGTTPNQAGPMLNTSENTGASKPMATRGGTTAYSSAMGLIERMGQNKQAQG